MTADREQTRRVVAQVEDLSEKLIERNADIQRLKAELEQAEQRVIDGAWDRSRLVEQLEQAERERDEVGLKWAQAMDRLAKVPALVEALKDVEDVLAVLGSEIHGERVDVEVSNGLEIVRDALADYEQEQEQA